MQNFIDQIQDLLDYIADMVVEQDQGMNRTEDIRNARLDIEILQGRLVSHINEQIAAVTEGK